MTAYDGAGNRIGQTYFTANLPGAFDQTYAEINVPGTRYVAFNYTDTRFGFYAIDDLTFTRAANGVPEPATLALLCLALAGLGFSRRKLH